MFLKSVFTTSDLLDKKINITISNPDIINYPPTLTPAQTSLIQELHHSFDAYARFNRVDVIRAVKQFFVDAEGKILCNFLQASGDDSATVTEKPVWSSHSTLENFSATKSARIYDDFEQEKPRSNQIIQQESHPK